MAAQYDGDTAHSSLHQHPPAPPPQHQQRRLQLEQQHQQEQLQLRRQQQQRKQQFPIRNHSRFNHADHAMLHYPETRNSHQRHHHHRTTQPQNQHGEDDWSTGPSMSREMWCPDDVSRGPSDHARVRHQDPYSTSSHAHISDNRPRDRPSSRDSHHSASPSYTSSSSTPASISSYNRHRRGVKAAAVPTIDPWTHKAIDPTFDPAARGREGHNITDVWRESTERDATYQNCVTPRIPKEVYLLFE